MSTAVLLEFKIEKERFYINGRFPLKVWFVARRPLLFQFCILRGFFFVGLCLVTAFLKNPSDRSNGEPCGYDSAANQRRARIMKNATVRISLLDGIRPSLACEVELSTNKLACRVKHDTNREECKPQHDGPAKPKEV